MLAAVTGEGGGRSSRGSEARSPLAHAIRGRCHLIERRDLARQVCLLWRSCHIAAGARPLSGRYGDMECIQHMAGCGAGLSVSRAGRHHQRVPPLHTG